MKESEIQAGIVKWLRAQGWIVVVTSWNRKMGKQMAGIPDVLAWRHGVHLMVETKSRTGQRRDSQVEFWLKIRSHLGFGVIYVLASSLLAVQDELRRHGLFWEKRKGEDDSANFAT